MRFYVLLALINIASFLPLYLLNLRAAPNPFLFFVVRDKTQRAWILRLMYSRYHSTDPFRIHFDFTFYVLLAAALGVTGPTSRLMATALLALGFIEILYTAIMHSVFKRAPALGSDVSLLRAGLSLAQRQAYWMVPTLLGMLVAIVWAAGVTTSALLAATPPNAWHAAVVAALLLPPCFFHATWAYDQYLWRTVYSPLLHFGLNLRFSALLDRLHDRDASHYERYNAFRDVRLEGAPNVVVVCVESYGSVAFRDDRAGAGLSSLLRNHEEHLTRLGYRVASTLSEAPLFAGGSWLSYTSFTYGTRIDNIQLYDGLFSRGSGFAAYESLFHVLNRNGYENVLLCPLGGVDEHTVDWASVDRCFHAQRRIGFDDLDYVGPKVNYLGIVRRYSPIDQFSLNRAYERARDQGDPFSLFFCTLNSHYPWHSIAEATDDWIGLNEPGVDVLGEPAGELIDRYNAAIRYQLDYLMRFARDRANDEPLIILFGDHQPPFITPEPLGKYTPVHVICHDQALIEAFLAHGFADTLDLSHMHSTTIRHEAFLSLLMQGLQSAWGTTTGLDLPFRERGASVFEDAWAELVATR